MPQRTGPHVQSRPSSRHLDERRPAPARRHPGAAAGDYTLAHAGHQVRIGPIAFWIVVGTLVIMGLWTVGTGTYFAFRDDVLTRLVGRQAEMQFAYEDRIAELRAQVDRITSRQLLDQEQFDHKLEQILRRQAALESRTSALSSLPDSTPTGSIRPTSRGTAASEAPAAASPKASPISDTVIFVAPPDREARLESRVPAAAARIAGNQGSGAIDGVLTRLQASLDRVEARQTATLNAMEESYDSKARRMRGVLADLGIDPSKTAPVGSAGGVGGPFVPVKLRDASAFDRQLYRISLARSHLDRLNRTLVSVPVRKPIVGEIDLTSTFGVRADPFLRGPAMHSGLDFRASTGDPVKVTAAGTVTQAGWNGGYGKLVEVDHGNGLATRYGHLSDIGVSVGQSVRSGQTIGRVGSTGRSTGPHLHYETRIDGEPVDPQKFLRAGLRLGERS
jgi:murein DD-endopeptidase MepM/ murein hydrolase activator NlpD